MTRVTMTLLPLLLGSPLADIAAAQDVANDPKDAKTAPPAKVALAERVEFSFGGGVKEPSLCLFGPGVNTVASVEPQGLRFNVPAGRKNPGNEGLESRLRLSGDFEITLDYELLALPDPGPKYVVGAFLQIAVDSPNDLNIRLGRANRATGSRFHAEMVTAGTNGKTNYKGFASPLADLKETKGRLRLVRTGEMLSCQVQEGGGEFREIATKDIGRADVVAVQAVCITSWQPVAVDIRFSRLEVRASTISNKSGPLQDKIADNARRKEIQFPEGIAKNPMLQFVRPEAEAMAAVQPGGLRFNVPADRPYAGDVGIESRYRLHGDFVITLDYELLDLPNPPPKLGAGAVLQIVLDSPDDRKARMDRLRRPNEDIFGANYIIGDNFRGLVVARGNEKETKGQLRMVRTDKLLTYQVQEGSVPFYEIARYDLGREDVIAVQALCATGWQHVPVDIRFPRLDLRSDKISGIAIAENVPLPVSDPPPTPTPDRPAMGGHTSLLIMIGLILAFTLLAMIGLSIYLWRGARRNRVKASEPAEAPQPVGFPCPDCRKKLTVKPGLVGKMVKCPRCGKAILVTESAEGGA
ncbi:MAG TPA: DUF1583 domain-containing protein [Gemmataceae bacterium]|nr:DUF1583 domain-containing protein [Gemmataceae bacterium]